LCFEMGEVAVSSDCSVVGVLCRSKTPPSEVAGVVDFVTDSGVDSWGFTNEVTDFSGGGEGRNDAMYLLEFTGNGAASRTNHGASSTVRVNAAIGGWMYGNWAISLDSASQTYVIDLKVTVGSHEGSMNVAIDRASWSWNRALSSGYACGTGHTMANQLTYSPELGTWARLCWTDGNDDQQGGVWAHYFQTIESEQTERSQILTLPEARNVRGMGGVASIVSLGAQGWIGVGYRPLPAHAANPNEEQQLTVTLVNLPSSSNDCGSQCTTFTDLPELPGRALWNYDGAHGALGFVNAQRSRGADELLIGYATRINRNGGNWPAPEYRVAKVNTAGEILTTQKLQDVGWGEEDMWVRLSNGCVAFPFVWDSAPGAEYGNNGGVGEAATARMSNSLRVTVLCDS